MQILLPPKHVEIYPIEVSDQLKKNHNSEQQKDVEAEHQEKKKKNWKT